MLEYIDRGIDLEETPKICCPFHEEDTPSFSYSVNLGIWSCFGSCKFGGDVISMHQKYHKMVSRTEAIESLALLFKIDTKEVDFTVYDNIQLDEKLIEYTVMLNKAESLCKGVSDYLELDYIMSFNKPRTEIIEDLDEFITHRSNSKVN